MKVDGLNQEKKKKEREKFFKNRNGNEIQLYAVYRKHTNQNNTK